MAKHISSKIITCSEKDAPWITSEVTTAIKHNQWVYRKLVNRGRNVCDLGKVREVRTAITKCIKEVNMLFKFGFKAF